MLVLDIVFRLSPLRLGSKTCPTSVGAESERRGHKIAVEHCRPPKTAFYTLVAQGGVIRLLGHWRLSFRLAGPSRILVLYVMQ